MSHYDARQLPSGETELQLKPIGSGLERKVYWAIVAAMLAGGLCLSPSKLGSLVVAVGVVSGVGLFRTTNRRETWLLAPGSAMRTVSGFGSSRETYVPVRVHAIARQDADLRQVVRLELEHQSGRVQIGTQTFDRDERALELARAFAQAAGVDAVLP